ncbi:ABC transporter substrate-binding protein [uncultured Methanospirillum sp.]|uniref:ABC transporter substrate-binding protein n=1 Tax=uncultured Methanospirillum sp. TaxID=262503 RepID=UPI0029C91407|nr:ABC transporter substrate-binding protein [uncultured Methanospirillum sp.]
MAGADIATVLLMIGAKDQVIGVGESIKKDPQIYPYYQEIESLGDSSTLNPEQLVSLNPDLLLVYASSQPSNLENLKKTGVPIGYFDCYKQNRLVEDIQALGIITGKKEKADELAEYIDSVTTLVKNRVAKISPDLRPKVYFELGDYTAAANQSGGDWLITTAGGRNIAENSTVQWVKVTPEWIISQNPDIIIKNGYSEPGKDLSDIYAQVANRSGFNTIQAVNSHHLYVISSDMLYGAQSCIGLLYVAKVIHPDLFADIDPNKYLDEFSRRYYPEGNASPILYPPILK